MDGQYERDARYETASAVSPATIPRPRTPVEPTSQGGVADAGRGRVVARYARLMRSGRPEVCRPGRRELRAPGPVAPGSDGKVIYPDRDAAECAARELEALGGRPQRSYLCARSRRGHFHLTTDLATERHRERVRGTIPRQRD